ncbi:MAG: AAA family ATPase [Spongiibacteraceae bacterium]|nr:AAA family ATPase [Spongiibacteraceae bacterium]
MNFEFRPALREKTSLLIALAGSSGSGKTYTALTMAEGLAGPDGKIAAIDTEAGRMLHYADQFDFDYGDLKPPFTPNNYIDAIQAADKAGYDVIVIDSISHVWDGDGGVREMQEAVLTRMAGTDYKKRAAMTALSWSEPKQAHKKMISKLLQCRAHIIFCLRAEQKMLMKTEVVDGKKKAIVIPADERPLTERWQPICEKNFVYEMIVSMLLLDSAPGVPVPVKIQDQHRIAFPPNQQVTKECGVKLNEWATGGIAVRSPLIVQEEARAAARNGRESFGKWWKEADALERQHANLIIDKLKKLAEQADAPPPDDNPLEQAPTEPTQDNGAPAMDSNAMSAFVTQIEACETTSALDQILAMNQVRFDATPEGDQKTAVQNIMDKQRGDLALT